MVPFLKSPVLMLGVLLPVLQSWRLLLLAGCILLVASVSLRAAGGSAARKEGLSEQEVLVKTGGDGDNRAGSSLWALWALAPSRPTGQPSCVAHMSWVLRYHLSAGRADLQPMPVLRGLRV